MFGKVLATKESVLLAKSSPARAVTRTIRSRFDDDEFISETRKAILNNTEISRNHLTPELRLHLLTPNCSMYHGPPPSQQKSGNTGDTGDSYDPATAAAFREPFWSIYWPGGQALTRFVLDEGRELFSNRNSNVLDIGTGSGATAIAAKLRGARDVVANDIEPVACVAVGMNAALNNVRLDEISRDNLLDKSYGETHDREPFDFVFVGDLLYDEEISVALEPWLDQAIERGAKIFLGDPGRHGITDKLKRKLRILRTYSLPENVKRENYGFQSATVFQFLKFDRK